MKQTATYGIWLVNRNDDGKVEIFKNGQLVDNNSAAFREIAAELGMDIDPEWRGSQLRSAVMKAMQSAGDEAPQKAPKKAPEKIEVIPADNSEGTDDGRLSIEQLCKLSYPDNKALIKHCEKCLNVLPEDQINEFLEAKVVNDAKLIKCLKKLGGDPEIPSNGKALDLLADFICLRYDDVKAITMLINEELLHYVSNNWLDQVIVNFNNLVSQYEEQDDIESAWEYKDLLFTIYKHRLYNGCNSDIAEAAKELASFYDFANYDRYGYYTAPEIEQLDKQFLSDAYRAVFADIAIQMSWEGEEPAVWGEKELIRLSKQAKQSKEPEKPATKYDVNSVENSEEFCKNNPDLKAFYKEWKSFDKSQFDALLSAAEKGDVMAQYKYGYILACLSRRKFDIEYWGWKLGDEIVQGDKALLERYSKFIDLNTMADEAKKWLGMAAEEGFGDAMHELAYHLLNQGKVVPAVRWMDKCVEVNPWRSYIDSYSNFDYVGSRGTRQYAELCRAKERGADMEETKDYWVKRCVNEEAKNASLNYYIEELEQKLKKAQAEVSAARSSASISSSSSSSRSSSDDNVKVEIKYKSQIKENGLTFSKTKVVTMTNAEYRSLRDGSMKARIAYVNSHCGIMTFAETVSDVSVSLA